MAFQMLEMDAFIQQDIKNSRRYCFVLGAGASRSSGIETGKEFVELWDKELRARNLTEYHAWRKKLRITDENKYNYYGQYFAKRYKKDLSEGQEFLEHRMENARPQIGYLLLAMIMEHNNNHNNVVITTNFDHLIEDSVIRYCKKSPLVIGHESLAGYVSSELQRPLILKIHRDLLMDPMNTPDDLEKLQPQWYDALNAIFSVYHPVFIGYAGNDRSVMTFLTENADKFASKKWKYPYWTVYRQEEPEEQVKEFLDASGAWLIRNNGFDNMMIRIGQALGCKMPPKDEFVKRIEKQYAEWMDAASKCQTEQRVPKQDAALIVQPTPEEKSTVTDSEQNEPESADTIYFDALMKSRLGQYQQALPGMQKAVQMEPAIARYHHSLAVTLHCLGRYEEAFLECKKATALEPDNAEYHNQLAITLQFLRRCEDALPECRKAIELEPDKVRPHHIYAVTLHCLERYKEALPEYNKVIALEPDNALYHKQLASALHCLGRYEEALPEIRKAIELEPHNALYHDQLAVTLHSLGRYEEALLEYNKAIELKPDNPTYHRNLAVTLRKLGWDDEAKAEDKKADELEKK